MSKWYAMALIIAGGAECAFSIMAQQTFAPVSQLWQQLFVGTFWLGLVLAAWGAASLMMMALARSFAPEPPLAEVVEEEASA